MDRRTCESAIQKIAASKTSYQVSAVGQGGEIEIRQNR
jgi:hypothetical protein